MWVGRGGRDGGLGGQQGRSLLCLPTTHSSAPSTHSALPPPLYLGFQCSKMHYTRCVSSGKGWMGWVNALCILYSMFCSFSPFWMTPKFYVRELGNMIAACSLIVTFPFYTGFSGRHWIMYVNNCLHTKSVLWGAVNLSNGDIHWHTNGEWMECSLHLTHLPLFLSNTTWSKLL